MPLVPKHPCVKSRARSQHWGFARWGVGSCILLLLAHARGDFVEEFAAPTPNWQLSDSGPAQRMVEQRRLQSPENPAEQFERLVLQGGAGYSAACAYDVGRVPVLDETKFECRIRGDRTGVQMALRVQFPRSRDIRTGEPLVALLHGPRYASPGEWQVLTLEDLPQLTERSARVLRIAPGQTVDTREATITHLVLLVPGGQGTSTIDIDRVAMSGINDPVAAAGGDDLSDLVGGPELSPAAGAAPSAPLATIQIGIESAHLRVDGQALLPRLLEYRGEPLELVTELGFNGLWLTAPPTDALVQAADKARLWIIAPPPPASQLARIEATTAWRAVLGWQCGAGIDGSDIDMVFSTTEAVRSSDGALRRPLVGELLRSSAAYRQLIDVMTIDVPLPHRDQAVGGATQRIAATVFANGPGTVVLASVALGLDTSSRGQLEAAGVTQVDWADTSALRDATLQSLASGAGGYVVRTARPLSSRNPATLRIRGQLADLNRQVQLAEPWLVRGTPLGTISDPAATLLVHLLQLDRTRLAIVTRNRQQAVGELTIAAQPKITLPGVPTTASGYRLVPGSVTQMELGRVAGGVEVTADPHLLDAFWLLTDDAQAVQQLRRHAAQRAPQVARLARDRAHADYTSLRALHDSLPKGRQSVAVRDLLPLAGGLLTQCDLAMTSGDMPRALAVASEVTLRTEQAYMVLDRQLVPDRLLTSYPTAIAPAAWAAQVNLIDLEGPLPRGDNRLFGGDFEQLVELQQAGWRHTRLRESVQTSSVSICPIAPRSGSACLRIATAPTAGQLDGEPAVWVDSPDVPLQQRELIEISGWVRVESPTPGGAMLDISDSLGGPGMRLSISDSQGWRAFRMLRFATSGTPLRLTFALSGQGSADLDAVMVRPLVKPHSPAKPTGGAAGSVAAQPIPNR